MGWVLLSERWEASTSSTRLPPGFNPLSEDSMSDDGLVTSLDRAERALERIERALSRIGKDDGARDEQLRAKVRDVVAELDSLIEGVR
jgi:hypothetical protein